MRLYQGMAEEVQFNWRTTARWALRARWAQRENEELRDALRHATERAERAEVALAECQQMNRARFDENKELFSWHEAKDAELEAVRGQLDAARMRAERAEAALAAMTDELASMTVRMQIAEDGRQIETRRAERALDTLARYEQQQWMARAIGAEAAEERMLAERPPRRIEGTLPADDLRRVFADGAAWWNFNSTGFTMFGSERRDAEAEAEARFPNGKPGPVEVLP